MNQGKLPYLLFPVLNQVVSQHETKANALMYWKVCAFETINTRQNSGLNNMMPNIY